MTTEPTTHTRRGILKHGATASGALFIGVTAATGTAAARGARGGSGFMVGHDYMDVADGTPFKITGAVPTINPHWLLETSPTCNGRARRKEYKGYRFVADGGDLGNVYLNPNRQVKTGEDWYVLEEAHECGTGTTQNSGTDWGEGGNANDPIWKITYRPA
ncbi:MAG: hypothetical protein R3324_02480 [Halobacteriales archaeon]|nr:hypothetical protein [Halobacteriales archaeon]